MESARSAGGSAGSCARSASGPCRRGPLPGARARPRGHPFGGGGGRRGGGPPPGRPPGPPRPPSGQSLWREAASSETVTPADRPYGSRIQGRLPVGCAQCTEGPKMVLFVTGLCSFHCFYCPVSDEKMYRDVVFADEKRVERDEDVLAEARATRAKGAGRRGGGPVEALDRTCHYIRLLKSEFGEEFPPHLYTMSTDPESIRRLPAPGPARRRPPRAP